MTSKPSREQGRRLVLGLVVVALAARLGYGAVSGRLVAPLEGDEGWYLQAAANLASGVGFTAFGEPMFLHPLWSVLLAPVFFVFGASAVVGRLVSLALNAIACALVYTIARRRFDPRPALVASLVAALWPHFLIYSTAMVTESLALLLTLAFVDAADRMSDPPRTPECVRAGVLAGLLSLTRGSFVLLPLLFPLWLSGRFALRGGALAKPSSVMLGCALAVILPWVIRNQLVFGVLVPLSANAGNVLYSVYHPDSLRADRPGAWVDRTPARAPGTNAAQHDRWLMREGFRELREAAIREPWLLARLELAKVRRLWLPRFGDHLQHRVGAVTQWLLTLGSATALARLWSLRRLFLIDLLLLAYVQLLALVFHSEIRMRMPLDALLIILVSAAAIPAPRAAAPRPGTRPSPRRPPAR